MVHTQEQQQGPHLKETLLDIQSDCKMPELCSSWIQQVQEKTQEK